MRFLTLLTLLFPGIAAAAVEVENLRVWPAPDNTRVVFDISAPVKYQVFTMANPNRVVIDLQQAQVQRTLRQPGRDSKLLVGVRYAPRDNGDLRIVFDLAKRVHVRSSVLSPNQQYGHRLLLELADETVAAGAPLPGPAVAAVAPAPVAVRETPVKSMPAFASGREVVVAVDAGHGGEDPGATGRHGTHEKDITLAIARRLADLINNEQGMRAVLIRDGDYFIPLRKRMEKARKNKADLFISIHADAYRDSRVRGSSVYVLSQRGASSEAARWLADQENASDYVGGVTLDDKDDLLKSVLIDLSQTASIEASIDVASKVLERLDEVGNIHRRRVQHAGFMVLKSPDIPSILVETAYITNPDEEKKLRTGDHQGILAGAIADGIYHYFEDNPPPGTLLAQRRENRLANNP